MIEAAQRYAPGGKVHFTGIDLFESAADVPASESAACRSLIGVFRHLRPTGASLRLLPGELGGVLTDAANTLAGTDLVIVGHTTTEADLAPAWFYLPRMLHAGSVVLREREASSRETFTFDHLPLSQIQLRASQPDRSAA
jgi:hypothetical protein